jgi:protein-tyrosine phosphatase
MVGSILVVCIGNVCRSPVGERLLRAALPGLSISSAGLHAMSGDPADPDTAAVAAARGLALDGHIARQFTPAIGAAHELILVMEAAHRRELAQIAPHLSGRTLLYGQWLNGGTDIPDPYRRSLATQDQTFELIQESAQGWIARVARKAPSSVS